MCRAGYRTGSSTTDCIFLTITARGAIELAHDQKPTSRKNGPAVWTAGPFENSAEAVIRKLLGEGVVEAVAGRFEVNVLAELAGFPSTMLAVHADVFPFD